MEVRMIRSTVRAGRRSREVASHLFRIGQIVRMKSRFGVSPTTAEFYRITGTLPPRDNSPQYRIRNDGERHERVATEDDLELAADPGGVSGRPLVERMFRNGQGTEAQQQRAPEAETGEGPTQR